MNFAPNSTHQPYAEPCCAVDFFLSELLRQLKPIIIVAWGILWALGCIACQDSETIAVTKVASYKPSIIFCSNLALFCIP